MLKGLLLSVALLTSAATDPRIEAGKHAVLSRLKDPESARFDQLQIVESGGSWILCGTVSAKNGFGGYNDPDYFIAFSDEAFLRSETFGSLRQITKFDGLFLGYCGHAIVQ